jgi:hypothetical protein
MIPGNSTYSGRVNGYTRPGNYTNGISSEYRNGESLSLTAPEVNHWTELLTQDLSNEDASTARWNSVLSDYDLQQIELYWERLLPTVNYLGTEQVARIYRALCVAYRAHRGQMRKSGDPFIIHPVEVALLLSKLKMDGETIIAGECSVTFCCCV